MCQLLGVSSARPVRLTFAWERFAERGSTDGGNPDGWGAAYFAGNDAQLFRSTEPAAECPIARLLGAHGPPSQLVISHVRRATAGSVALRNTQPFLRRVGGRTHVFAHNGFVGHESAPLAEPPIGETDSERLFLALLARVLPLWSDGVPPLAARREVVREIGALHRARGAANFLYSDGVTLFAHAHRETLPGDAISDAPGLYWTQVDDDRLVGPCVQVRADGTRCHPVLVATRPLDDGDWHPMASGELACFEDGRPV